MIHTLKRGAMGGLCNGDAVSVRQCCPPPCPCNRVPSSLDVDIERRVGDALPQLRRVTHCENTVNVWTDAGSCMNVVLAGGLIPPYHEVPHSRAHLPGGGGWTWHSSKLGSLFHRTCHAGILMATSRPLTAPTPLLGMLLRGWFWLRGFVTPRRK